MKDSCQCVPITTDPRINDHAIPTTLQAAEKLAKHAWMMLLRLPGNVYPYFKANETAGANRKIINSLHRYPNKTRAHDFGYRFHGDGPEWQITKQMFGLHKHKLGFTPIRP